MSFDKHSLDIDPAAETERIVSLLRDTVSRVMHRRGGVVGISGGVDSAVVLALCVRAFGPQRVTALMLPEADSDPISEQLARQVAQHYGVEPVLEEITPALAGFGCYRRRDEAIRRVFPEFDAAAGYKAKIVLPPNLLDQDTLNVFSLTIITPTGEEKTMRLPLGEYHQIVAASNFKQRTRMAMLYYHAELRHYAVIGTANKNEHDQGFFVKHGDGGVDVQPIVHLFKTQVYQLAEYLNVPAVIRRRPPTSDTYSAPCTQQEFFFRLPFETMDLLWYAQSQTVPVAEVAQGMGLTETQVQRAFADFTRKQHTTDYLRLPPLGVDSGDSH
ncbi:MAG: NAD(+) synthase [Anaerolineae bacterium]|nr:NAD(+) synthase [Anaerolineae bacterium]